MKSALCLAIVFLIALIGVGWLMRSIAQEKWPHAAAINFGMTPSYSPATVRSLIDEHGAEATRYIFPGLFPLDLLFLICLGGTLALFSLGFAEGGATGRLWLVLLLPVGYMIADLAENVALARLLSGAAEAVTGGMVTFTQALTILKQVLVVGSALQVVYLFVCWVLRG
jgi:hypothetical protein